MIPRDYITAWRSEAPWVQDFQVEQDLIISKALVDIFSEPLLRDSLAFRGGTTLYKLFLKPSLRYSEDIDLANSGSLPGGAPNTKSCPAVEAGTAGTAAYAAALPGALCCNPCRKSTARCACAAAVRIVRMSSRRTLSQEAR